MLAEDIAQFEAFLKQNDEKVDPMCLIYMFKT